MLKSNLKFILFFIFFKVKFGWKELGRCYFIVIFNDFGLGCYFFIMRLILILVTYKYPLCMYLCLLPNNSRIKACLESFLKCSSSLVERVSFL